MDAVEEEEEDETAGEVTVEVDEVTEDDEGDEDDEEPEAKPAASKKKPPGSMPQPSLSATSGLLAGRYLVGPKLLDGRLSNPVHGARPGDPTTGGTQASRRFLQFHSTVRRCQDS